MAVGPPVSVLLPVRDEERYVADALASLSAQSFGDFEAIVVDDGSRDATAEIAEEHARRDRRFRVLRRPGEGIVRALEAARRQASGRLLARMDGDDLALPGRLAVQVEALEEERLDAVGGGVEHLSDGKVTDGARHYAAWLNGLTTVEAARRDVFVECPIAHPTLVARASAVAAVGGYRDRGWAEDYDLLLRLWARGARFRNVGETVLRWRDHPGRLQRTHGRYALEAFVRCKVDHLSAALLGGFDGVVVWGTGPVGKSFARELLRRGGRLAAFVDVDPRKVGKTVYAAPVVAVEDGARYPHAFAIGAVSGEEPRSQIREAVAAQGRRDGVDFVAVA